MPDRSLGPPAVGSDSTEPASSPKSRIDPAAERAALASVSAGRIAEAVQLLMTTYGAAVYGYVVRIVRDPDAAKDVRQQVFIEAFQGIHQFERRSSLWTWLCGIAHHRSLDELKRVKRRAAVDDFDVVDRYLAQPEPVMDADLLAKRRALERCLAKFPPAMRSQLLMRCFLGLSHAEIGHLVSDNEGTVQVRISRSLPRLQRCLRQEGVR